jgi:thiol-disulfide isomerase/thioredoxin
MHRPALLLPLLLLLAAGCVADPDAPAPVDARAAFGFAGDAEREIPDAFDADAPAMAEVDAALARARTRGAKTLVVLGANWCHDSRGFAWRLTQPEVAPLIAESYEVVFVDVGFRDRNLDIARRFGVDGIRFTPTVLVVSPEGALLNPDSVEHWRTASTASTDEVADYLRRWSGDAAP